MRGNRKAPDNAIGHTSNSFQYVPPRYRDRICRFLQTISPLRRQCGNLQPPYYFRPIDTNYQSVTSQKKQGYWISEYLADISEYAQYVAPVKHVRFCGVRFSSR